METAQNELGIESVNNVPVVYKSEVEPSSLSGLLPTLLIIGFLIYMMRRSADMMGGRSGRKGGGLFGGVMQSTAKLINSNEIDVRFKYDLFILFGAFRLHSMFCSFRTEMWPVVKRPKSKLWNL